MKSVKGGVLILDNYDSFTYILADYFARIDGVKVQVFLNDKISLKELIELNPTHLVVSPGPGNPAIKSDFGVCAEAIQYFYDKIPVLGVCLGHQGLAIVLGGSVSHAPVPVHGMRSMVEKVSESNLFTGLPKQFDVMRYHSLIVTDLQKDFVVTLKTDDGLIMAMEHKKLPVFGVQFHPESIGTDEGMQMIKNFVGLIGV